MGRCLTGPFLLFAVGIVDHDGRRQAFVQRLLVASIARIDAGLALALKHFGVVGPVCVRVGTGRLARIQPLGHALRGSQAYRAVAFDELRGALQIAA